MKTETLLQDVSSFCAGLDSIQTNVFIADMELKLVYMNPKAEKTLIKV